ncbi:MAG: NPCBM/NEW2 domain-containing protein [Planctomycetaceae bacterium]
MLPSLSLILALLLLPADDVRITLLDGTTKLGSLLGITETAVQLESDSARTEIPLSSLLLLESTAPETPANDAPPQQIWLRNGGQLSGSSVAQSARTVSLLSPRLGQVSFPVTAVNAVRLQPGNDGFRPAWDAFRQRQTEQDLLVVLKRDGSGLDFLAGVISSASSEKIELLLDGETVPVPASRVYGLVFGQPAGQPAPIPAVRASLAGGDLIAGSSLLVTGPKFKFLLSPDNSLEGPTEVLRQIDFSGGRLRSLAELQPLEIRFLGTEPADSPLAAVPELQEAEKLLWGPRLDGTIPGTSGQYRPRIGGREVTRCIAMHSAAEITWELSQKYEQLDALAAIDDTYALANAGGNALKLTIQADDAVVFDQQILGRDQPIPLSLSLKGVSTLTIKVDFGDGSGIGDWLILGDPRLRITQ